MTGAEKRSLVLVRHAKSAYPDGVTDFDRPLSPRGESEAPLVGEWLSSALVPGARILVSAAKRTRDTWALAATAMTIAIHVEFERGIYEASPQDLLQIIRAVAADVPQVVLVGHSPGLESLALVLSEGKGKDDLQVKARQKFPTSAILVLETDLPWAELASGQARLVNFYVARAGKKPITKRQSLR